VNEIVDVRRHRPSIDFRRGLGETGSCHLSVMVQTCVGDSGSRFRSYV
jgi:hypothetical protein